MHPHDRLSKAVPVRVSAHLSEFSDTSPGAALYATHGASYRGRVRTASGEETRWGRRAPSGRVLASCLVLGWVVACGISNAHAGTYDDALRDGAAARDVAQQSHLPADWERARRLFERAVAARDSMAARFELAQAAAELGEVDVAYESHELALEHGLSGRAAGIARAFLDAHRGDVARVDVVAPAGTRVVVNGRERARAPLSRPLVVPAGVVRLGLIAPESKPWEESRELEAQATLRLAPELAPAASLEAWPGPSREEQLESQPSWLGQHPAAIVLLSLAGVSLAGGGVLGLSSMHTRDRANDARTQIMSALAQYVDAGVVGSDSVPCGADGIANGMATFDPSYQSSQQSTVVTEFANACRLFNDRTSSADRTRTLAFVGLGVGVAAAATVLTWYLVDGGQGASSEADHGSARLPRISPLIDADARGVLFEMDF
jgi:hypothetical protein